jgi:hypothetical protein
MQFWVYENTIHRKARIHCSDCSFCADGRGIHGGGETISGKWYGPCSDLRSATAVAQNTRQPDIRPCGVCIGAADVSNSNPGAIEINSSLEDLAQPEPWDWDRREELACSLRLNWVPADRVILDATGKLHFPTAPTSGGLYRFKTEYPDGRFAVYVGESDNLRRRFSNYRNPGPTQQTSLRINAWLRELLSSGGEISVALVDQATMSSEAGTANANFSQKSVRRLFEQLAISVEHASEIESLNR